MNKKRLYVYIDEAAIKEKPDEEVFCATIIEDNFIDDYREKINNLREDILDDPFYSEPFCGKNNQKALKKSFHMTEISPETRERFLNLIRYFSFVVLIYVYHDTLNENEKRCDYIKKLYKRLQQRYKETEIILIWEEDSSKISWPSGISVQKIKKGDEALLEISDCVAWIFCRKYYEKYINKEDFEVNRDKKFYELFKDKIRYIKVDNINKPFTKDNPLP